MALHSDLPIYKVAYDLLGVVVQLVRNMPREFKQSIGGTIRDECIAIATLVFRANVARDKAPHLLELVERLQVASLIGLERNALTYAGHTVWNTKRGTTPREQWVIQRDTHQPAISDDDAEALLARLGAPRRSSDRGEAYLLAGLLRAPSGAAWQGNAGYYRLGAKNISAPRLEETVLAKVVETLRAESFAAALVKSAKKARPRTEEALALAEIEGEVRRLESRVSAFADAIPQTTAKATLFAKIEEAEGQIRAARAQGERLKAEAVAAARLREIGLAEVRVMLNTFADQLPNLDRLAMKDSLRQLLESVELDATTPTCRIHYRIAASGVDLASPRSSAANPTFRATRLLPLQFRRLRPAA